MWRPKTPFDFDPYKEKEKKTKKKRPGTFRKYAVTFFKESSVTGVSAIIRSKGCCRKLVKVLILVFGVLGFLFHTFEFLKLYWLYTTMTQVSRMKTIDKPAITICDENLIRRIYICEKKPEVCGEYEYYLCDDVQAYCLDENDIYYLLPIGEDYKLEYIDEYFDLNFTKESGFQIQEALISCKWFYSNPFQNTTDGLMTSNCSKPTFIRGMTKDKLPGSCYTFESTTGGKSISHGNLEENAGLTMILKWRPSDLNNVLPAWDPAGQKIDRVYYVSVHAPALISNPFVEGFKVLQGKMYRVTVSQIDHIRMPPPYDTKCYDYTSDWIKNGGFGSLVKEDCQDECEIRENYQEYGCIPTDVDYPHEKPLCFHRHSHNSGLTKKIKECVEKCQDACTETNYVVENEIIGQISINDSKLAYNSPTVVTIDFQFDTLNSAVYKDKPKYESVELFSYIGGYLGMWLGWSLVAIFDFFEIAFHIIKYPFTLRKRRRLRKMQVKPFVPDYYYY